MRTAIMKEVARTIREDMVFFLTSLAKTRFATNCTDSKGASTATTGASLANTQH